MIRMVLVQSGWLCCMWSTFFYDRRMESQWWTVL